MFGLWDGILDGRQTGLIVFFCPVQAPVFIIVNNIKPSRQFETTLSSLSLVGQKDVNLSRLDCRTFSFPRSSFLISKRTLSFAKLSSLSRTQNRLQVAHLTSGKTTTPKKTKHVRTKLHQIWRTCLIFLVVFFRF